MAFFTSQWSVNCTSTTAIVANAITLTGVYLQESTTFLGIEAVCIAIGFFTYHFVSRSVAEDSLHQNQSAREKSATDYIRH